MKKMSLGVDEKAVIAYLILLVAVLVLIGYLMFVQFGLEDQFTVPFWNLLLFSVVIFSFLVYIWDRSIPGNELFLNVLKMIVTLYLWSAFTGFLAFLLDSGSNLGQHLEYAYTSLLLFFLNMLFVIMIFYLQIKVFANPLLRGILEVGTERSEEKRENEFSIDTENSEDKANPFEFQPDPLVSFEELPAFFIKRVKGLLGIIIFDRKEGLVLASSIMSKIDYEKMAALTTNLILEQKGVIKPFSVPKTRIDNLILLENRIIAFSSHISHPVFFLFDSRVPFNYIKRVMESVPVIIEEWLRKRAFTTLKGS